MMVLRLMNLISKVDGLPDIGVGSCQTTEKSTMKKVCLVLRHKHSFFHVEKTILFCAIHIEKTILLYII